MMNLHKVKECLNVHISDISGSIYDDVNMSGSTISNVNLAGCSFRNVNISGAAFEDVNMSGWKVHDVNLSVEDHEIKFAGRGYFGKSIGRNDYQRHPRDGPPNRLRSK
jgi:Pentapeptide repeats (8 copies)